MARYRGPRAKISRKFNEPIFGPSKALQNKPYPPGQHGRGRIKKKSEYATQLAEKQRAKYTYGVLEKQFSNLFKTASSKSGVTGEILLQLLETRLDNTVYRLGIAPSRRSARQLITHKHITVNGSVVNIPSYSISTKDIIGVREKSKSLLVVSEALAVNNVGKYPWLNWDSATLTGHYISVPTREEIPEKITEQLIVELYSK